MDNPTRKSPDEKFCFECGAVIRARAEICPKCGVRQTATKHSLELQERNIVDNPTLAFAVYVLYIIGYFTGITALIGVIIAHVQSGAEAGYLRTHYQFQIRTFWIGLLYLVIGSLLAFVIIGWFILLWWLIWSLIRIVKGLLLLNKGAPIPMPESWGFGG